MFSVTIAASSLQWGLHQLLAGEGESGSAQAPGGTHPGTSHSPPLPGHQRPGLRSQTPVVLFSILLPNRKVHEQLTLTKALLLGCFFLYAPDVLKCAAPDASPPTGRSTPSGLIV